MHVITNRAPVPDRFPGNVGSHDSFAETLAPNNPAELRLCKVDKHGGRWRVRPVSDVAQPTPSAVLDATLGQVEDVMHAEGRHCAVFVHGFGKTFREALEQGERLEKRFDTEVIVFTWPASPQDPDLAHSYREACRVALASSGALDGVLEMFARRAQSRPFDRDRLEQGLTFNLMIYSLGNLLLQSIVSTGLYANETRAFANVVLAQADVDCAGHERWVDRVVAGNQLYVTTNVSDVVLGFSEAFHSRPRLGNTALDLRAEAPMYFDFSGHKKVNMEHQLWGKVDFPPVKEFFQRVLKGDDGELANGWQRNDPLNRYELKGRIPFFEKPPRPGEDPFGGPSP